MLLWIDFADEAHHDALVWALQGPLFLKSDTCSVIGIMDMIWQLVYLFYRATIVIS